MDRAMPLIERRERRQKSSIFEMNTESMMLTDILDALKTEQVEPQPLEDSRKQTVQFLRRMLGHLKELCLTKMSTKDVQSLTEVHIENVTALPLNTALTYYFGEMVPEVDRLVQRLKRVSHKKFTVLIRRKISEMFTEIMRHTYQMKLAVVVEKLKLKQQQRQATQTLVNMILLLDRKSQVGPAFRRIKSLQTSMHVHRGTMYDSFARSFSNLDRICMKRNLKHKLGYMGLWRSNVKLMAYDSTSQINNLIKTIYLSMVGVIEDEAELHSIVNLSLKKISGSEAAQFKLFKTMESLLVFYDDHSEEPHEPQVQSASGKELSCLELLNDNVVYDSEEGQRIMLLPVSSSTDEPVGLFHIPLEQDMSAKTLENVFALSKGLGEILRRIYLIRNRLTYYDRDCRSVNHIAQCMYSRLLEMVGEREWQAHLDMLFGELEMEHFQILFVDGETHQSFYKYCPEDNQYVELTACAVALFKEEFLKNEAKPFISVNKGQHKFTIFPIWEEGAIKGLIKFGYPFQIPTAGLVEAIETFVGVLIARSSPKQLNLPESEPKASQVQLSARLDLTEQGLGILKAQCYEDIEEAFTHSVDRLTESTKLNYYACLMWPLLRNKNPPCYWAHNQSSGILTIDSKHSSITSIIRSAQPVEYLSLSSNDELAAILKKFALYKNHKLVEYEKQSCDFRTRAIAVRNRLNDVLCIMLVATLDDSEQPANDIEEKSFLQVRDFIKIRLRKAEQVAHGVFVRDEHEKKAAKEFHQLASSFTVDYSNFYESLDRMLNQMGSNLTSRVYRLHKDYLYEHFSEERYGCKSLSTLPKHPYCSHNKLSFSQYHLRFRNKLIVNSKRTIMNFRSQSLKQQLMQLVQTYREEEQPMLQELVPQMTSLQQLLGLTSKEYLYLPIDYNLFMVIASERKWVASQVDLLHRFIMKEYQQHCIFKRQSAQRQQQLSLQECLGIRKQYRTRQLRETVAKFLRYRELVQIRTQRLQEYVKQSTADATLELSRTFDCFKQCSAAFRNRIQIVGSKIDRVSDCITDVYSRRVFALLKDCSNLSKHKAATFVSSIASFCRQVDLRRSELLQYSFSRIDRFSQRTLFNRKVDRENSLLGLASLMRNKQKLQYKESLKSMNERWEELLGLFVVVTEELQLVQFSSSSTLFTFLDERLSQPLQRLHKPFNSLNFLFDTKLKSECQYKHYTDYFLFEETQQNVITVGWELTEDQFLTVTLSSKLRLSGKMLDHLLKLKAVIQRKHGRLVRSIRTKLSFLTTAWNNLASSNQQAALRCMHRHTRRVIKEQNKKAKLAAREVQGQLAELSQEGGSNKQNENLQRDIMSHRKVISQIEGQFESLKLDNKIKRKTLSVSYMLMHQQHNKQQASKCELFVRKLTQVSEAKKLGSIREKESEAIEELKLKRCGHGLKLVHRFQHHVSSRITKQSFEWILGCAHRHSSLLR